MAGLLGMVTPGSLVKMTARALTTGVQVATWSEREVMTLLRNRLEASNPRPIAALPGTSEHVTQEPGSRLNDLLDQARGQSTASGRSDLFHKLVDQLLPDEARILGALSDDSVSPLVHVFRRSVVGAAGDAVLPNASLVGKVANVALPQMTPIYVTHLITLGLLETGPEDPGLKDEYQILTADPGVLRAIKRASIGPIPARIDRQVVRMSALGSELWAELGRGNS